MISVHRTPSGAFVATTKLTDGRVVRICGETPKARDFLMPWVMEQHRLTVEHLAEQARLFDERFAARRET